MEKCERIRRMKQCIVEKLDLRLILDEYSSLIINEIAQTTNVSIDYIFLTTIIALCHWTMGASLKGAQAYNTPLILFGILCGGSGSKKSASIRIVKEACEPVEALDGTPVKKSSINASVNMESLCCELEQQPNLLQLWDELSVFFGIFGSTRVDRTAYDRGLMCEFYSPTGIVRRQLVSRHNVMIKPRLNIIAAGHPKRTIECLTGIALKSQDPKDQNDDGLFNRFLIAVAYKHRPNREIIEPNKKIPKLDSMNVPENEVMHIKKYIENHPSDRLLLSSLPANLKRKISKDQYLLILRQMEEEGRGKIEETNNTTGPKAIVFTKKKKFEHPPKTSSSTTNQQTNEIILIPSEQTDEPSSTNQSSSS
ncbi:unnamed protein product [Adineta steineri]|uniref:DUF3987 domain-containing protein n=1 Tax=Adineta steineri TaxID=433720 RepID=A0A814WLM2_9BILA|nr:unnamed protein product [Adineta steineri]